MNNKEKKPNLIFLTICFLLVLVIYGQTIFGNFVFDDRHIVDYRYFFSDINQLHKVISLPYWAKESGLYRPITLLTYSFNYILFGQGAWSFHLVNIILYALTGFLIFLLIKKLFSNRLLSYLACLLFLVLPIHTEVVANIIGRAEILALFFSLLFFLELIKKKVNFWRVGLWFLLALGSKEIAIIILPIALLVIYLKEKQLFSLKIGKKYFPSLVAIFVSNLIYFGARFLVLGQQFFLGVETTIVENSLKFEPAFSRIATGFKILATIYFKKTLLPFNLCSDYSYKQISVINSFLNREAIIGIAVFLFFIIGFFIFLKAKPFLSLGSLIFVFGFLPVSNILFPIGTIAGERLIYFPSLGICFYLAGFIIYIFNLAKTKTFKLIIFWLVIVLLSFYAITSIIRSSDWLSEKRLFNSAAKCAPNSVLSRSNLGAIYYLEGNLEKAKEELFLAQRIYDKYPKGVNNLGLIYWKEGNQEKARELFLKALNLPRPYYGAYENLGLMALEKEDYQEAKEWLVKFFTGNQKAADDYIRDYKAQKEILKNL